MAVKVYEFLRQFFNSIPGKNSVCKMAILN
jgi:hypothetical protein